MGSLWKGLADKFAEGLKEGFVEGLKEGFAEGLREGIEEARPPANGGRGPSPSRHTTSGWEEALEAPGRRGSDALYKRALSILSGMGDGDDERKLGEAMALMQEAAEQDHIEAQDVLGFLYRQLGDYDRGDAWQLRAAENGHLEAQAAIGRACIFRNDYDGALRWLVPAAREGNPTAMAQLGFMYHYGRGLEQDHREACRLYVQAFELGSGEAALRLGSMYEEGNYVECDPVQAAVFYARGARMGFSLAAEKLKQLVDSVQPTVLSRIGRALGEEGLLK